MKILHIGCISTSQANGVSVAVPQHIISQAKYAEVAFVNINGTQINGIDRQYQFTGAKGFPGYLPQPFNKPDIVVFHEANVIGYISIYQRLIDQNIPYIIVPHGEITKQALHKKWLKKKMAYILFFNRFIKNAAAVQCLSDGEKADTVIAKNKIVIPNGTHEIAQKSPLCQLNNSGQSIRIAYIGRLECKVKGLDLLTEAVRIEQSFLREQNVHIDIYGPDIKGRRAEVQQLIDAAAVGDLITIYDPVFGAEKDKVLRSHNLFIQTSRTEGLPMGILEALAYGLPVIVTKGTRLLDKVVEYSAGYDAGESVVDIAKALREACQSRDRWTILGENGRNMISKEFSWDSVAKKSISVYKELIQNQR